MPGLFRQFRKVFLVIAVSFSNVAMGGANDAAVLGLGYGPLGYTLPAVGSYELARLGTAADGVVVTSADADTRLHDLFDGKIVLLSFMYSSCSDVNGCPLSAYVFHTIKTAMQADSALAENVRLISMSFDPGFDTPARLRLYEEGYRYAGEAGDWLFLTARSQKKLQPVLAAYRQDIDVLSALEPSGANAISHMLRVYLIDRDKEIRNIYSVSFLHPDILLNDVKTLLAEAGGPMTGNDPATTAARTADVEPPQAGDDRTGYESSDYKTNSRPLNARQGTEIDLLALTENPPLGLPAVPIPANNPVTREKLALGRKIFFDRRLSINDTVSCAACHVPEQGFAANELATAVGVEGRTVRRNTMTLYNVAYANRLFHDGREENLEQQVWNPLLARNEMANPSIGYVLNKIRSYDDYDGMFDAAFPDRGLSMETVGMALASYQRSLLSGDSPFDRWYFGGERDALSATAEEGFRLFTGKAGCVSCHTIDADSALFSDYELHNTGLGYRNSVGAKPKTRNVTIAPGLSIDIDAAIIDRVSERPPADVGLYEITEDPKDRWKYRTPTLRNVALTAPYMHNGELRTLMDVVDFYNEGGVEHALQDPRVRPLGLNAGEQAALVAFLQSLTGSNVNTLVSDAFAAPIGDPREKDAKYRSQ